MILPDIDYELAADRATAVTALSEGAAAICGGTELLAAMGLGLADPGRLVSVRAIPELRGISEGNATVEIGATVTHRELAQSDLLTRTTPLIAHVAERIGNARVRATGTVGGNLAFAEPRSDLVTALWALAANVRVAGASGEPRSIPIDEFVVGAYETTLRPGELILGVSVPVSDRPQPWAFRKVVFSERPIVNVAIVRRDATHRWRVVLGAVGDVPVMTEVDDLTTVDAAELADAADVTEDLAGDATYKRHLAAITVTRCAATARAADTGADT